ncbi:MAG: ammonium transporter [Chitinophagaceae bacterium]|jgi:Amt family ammonium transporter|nr:ammonium transporter [Chitinophagaceae bacterium]MCE2973298.1 ammonium transporter [Sediminibacterium sp.]MCA6471584.1 ammonium transporter [Chitinophagaceae bacterium]MCA6471981.1 ammonium transporter [Chitinophagaceae bacterium]MCA6476721.1 ammonium transporter [Chitinophagaceae bacterium]
MSNPIVKKYAPFVVLFLIAIGALFVPNSTPFPDTTLYNAADITWLLIATALVFLMTPGLAFFYGGMVHRKNIISTMIKSMVATGVVSILWIVIGYSLCFGESIGGFIGNPSTHLFFKDVLSGAPWSLAPTIPLTLFALFQLMFAVITPGLVVGAVAERIRFTAYTLFIVLFSILVYAPIAHWSWNPEGFLFKMGALDFAGGTVVHISAGCAALAGAIILKRRKAHIENKEIPPANIPYVLIGTGLLWFGWFGFNAGSALGANALAVSAFATTNTAAAAAGLSWMFFDVVRGKKPSVLGFCIGAVVGLVAITPSAGFVAIPSSIFIGAVAALISNLAVYYKSKSKLDDTLDVFPCHGLGGMVGMVLTGIFATKTVNSAGNDGLFYGNYSFLFTQLKALFIVVSYSFIMSLAIFKFIDLILPLRVSEEEEEMGLDYTQHAEKYGRAPLQA